MSDITAVRQSMHWSAEAKEQVRSLWMAGDSASVIAGKMGITSRSAIIGLVHRMGLGGLRRDTQVRLYRGKPHRLLLERERQPKPPRPPRPKKRSNGIGIGIRAPKPAEIASAKAEWEALKARIAASPPPATAKSLIDLEDDECRWPYGDGPYVFCGCKKAPGSPYCAEHAMVSIAGTAQQAEHYANKVALRWAPRRVGETEKNIEELHETVAA